MIKEKERYKGSVFFTPTRIRVDEEGHRIVEDVIFHGVGLRRIVMVPVDQQISKFMIEKEAEGYVLDQVDCSIEMNMLLNKAYFEKSQQEVPKYITAIAGVPVRMNSELVGLRLRFKGHRKIAHGEMVQTWLNFECETE